MLCVVWWFFFFFQAEDGIRDLVRSRGLGDVYKRQFLHAALETFGHGTFDEDLLPCQLVHDLETAPPGGCLLYTSDAADERSSVDLGGRRIIKKKKEQNANEYHIIKDTIKPIRRARPQH